MRRVLDGLYLLAGYLAGLCLLLVLFFMMALSFGRVIGINVKDADQFGAWFMGALTFLGLAHTFKSGEMIRVELLLERLPAAMRRLGELLCLLVAATAVGYFTWAAWQFVSYSYITGEPSQGLIIIPLWIPQSAMLIGLILFELAILDELACVLAGRKPSYQKEPPQSPEEVLRRVAEGGGV